VGECKFPCEAFISIVALRGRAWSCGKWGSGRRLLPELMFGAIILLERVSRGSAVRTVIICFYFVVSLPALSNGRAM